MSKSELILTKNDSLGKWSFVDIFVIIITLVGFRIIVRGPTGGMFGVLQEFPELNGLYSLDLYVVPCWGLYANMIAQIISQLSSHFIIHCHRKIVSDCLIQDEAENSNNENIGKRALCKHPFTCESSRQTNVVRGVNVGLLVTALAIVCFYVCGCLFTIFSIESYGILGVLVEVGENTTAAVAEYTILDIVEEVAGQARFTGMTTDYIGLVALSGVFIFTVLIVPMLLVLLLLCRWLVPMDKKGRWRNFILIETLSAWQYSEVFILSIVIAAWQLGPLSVNLVNDYCLGLDGFFDTIVSLGLVEGIDGQCFRAEATVNAGLWLLTLGALLLAFLNHFVKMAAQQQVEEDSWAQRNHDLPQSTGTGDESDTWRDNDGLRSIAFSDFYRCLLTTVESRNV